MPTLRSKEEIQFVFKYCSLVLPKTVFFFWTHVCLDCFLSLPWIFGTRLSPPPFFWVKHTYNCSLISPDTMSCLMGYTAPQKLLRINGALSVAHCSLPAIHPIAPEATFCPRRFAKLVQLKSAILNIQRTHDFVKWAQEMWSLSHLKWYIYIYTYMYIYIYIYIYIYVYMYIRMHK